MPKKQLINDKQFPFLLPTELHTRIKEAAKAEDVSMAEWLRRAAEMRLGQASYPIVDFAFEKLFKVVGVDKDTGTIHLADAEPAAQVKVN